MTLENPAKCGVCGAFWDFQTDWLGGLHAIHPVTKCVPRPAPVYEQEDEPEHGWERRCIECDELFTPRFRQSQSKICGAECRKVRRDRFHRESNARAWAKWRRAA